MSRHVARFLAPLAIAAVAVGVYLIVHGNLGTHSASSTTVTRPDPRHRHPAKAQHHSVTHAKPTYYTVRSGDTLSSIAQKAGVSLARVEALNPSVNADSLHTGERVEVRR